MKEEIKRINDILDYIDVRIQYLLDTFDEDTAIITNCNIISDLTKVIRKLTNIIESKTEKP